MINRTVIQNLTIIGFRTIPLAYSYQWNDGKIWRRIRKIFSFQSIYFVVIDSVVNQFVSFSVNYIVELKLRCPLCFMFFKQFERVFQAENTFSWKYILVSSNGKLFDFVMKNALRVVCVTLLQQYISGMSASSQATTQPVTCRVLHNRLFDLNSVA